MNYIVQSGDSLSKIARDRLGDITLWEDLAKHNNIQNPNLIYPGQVINLDIPKRVTIPVTPVTSSSGKGEGSIVLQWLFGFSIAVATAIAVKKLTEKKDDKLKS